ncbi:hypothetical protein Gotur_009839 [Gossypium turneri]
MTLVREGKIRVGASPLPDILIQESIKWDNKGLAVVIAQNVDTGAILMQGFVNRDALATTITSRKATFFSRSRATLWTKGETSNNFINIYDIFVDCDRNSIIYLGKSDGPTCHTGSETCYFTSIGDLLKEQEVEETNLALTTLYSLESTISKRELELTGKTFFTNAGKKQMNYAKRWRRKRTVHVLPQKWHHAMVLLRRKDVKIENVLEVLRRRFSQSGIEEKQSRASTES